MEFEWDENKNKANKRKHGISFETAALIFQDPFIVSILDDRYEYFEERWQSVGILGAIVIHVVHIIEEKYHDEEIIRIISARKATPSEEQQYYIHQKSCERTQSN